MSDPSLYDEVPYPGRAFPQTHPDRLATMATLYGLDAAPPDACRVLELGCGDGGNLLPMALALPGLDASSGSTLRARDRAGARAGRASSASTTSASSSSASRTTTRPPAASTTSSRHGVYSWVRRAAARPRARPGARRRSRRTRRRVRELQRPARPHARARRCATCSRSRCEGIDEPPARMAAARELLDGGVRDLAGRRGPRDDARRPGAHARSRQDDALFFHDTLAPINHAPYFREFAAHAARARPALPRRGRVHRDADRRAARRRCSERLARDRRRRASASSSSTSSSSGCSARRCCATPTLPVDPRAAPRARRDARRGGPDRVVVPTRTPVA